MYPPFNFDIDIGLHKFPRTHELVFLEIELFSLSLFLSRAARSKVNRKPARSSTHDKSFRKREESLVSRRNNHHRYLISQLPDIIYSGSGGVKGRGAV